MCNENNPTILLDSEEQSAPDMATIAAQVELFKSAYSAKVSGMDLGQLAYATKRNRNGALKAPSDTLRSLWSVRADISTAELEDRLEVSNV